MEPFIDTRGLYSMSDATAEHIPGHIRRAISEMNVELLDALRRTAQSGSKLPIPEDCRALLVRMNHVHQRNVGNCGLVLVDVEQTVAKQAVGAIAERSPPESSFATWLEPHEAQALIQSVWMVSWYLCQWNERVARILLDLPSNRTLEIACSAPRDWVQWSRESTSGVVPRWPHNVLMWRTLLSSGDRVSIATHQRLVGRGLQLSAGALLARREGLLGFSKVRSEP